MEDIIKCSTCKKRFLNNKEQVELHFGYNRLNERFKCCIRCRDYSKKRTKLQNKQADAALRGLQYCEACEKAKDRYEFIMSNGKSHTRCCRTCLIYGSDEDDSGSSYSDQCVYDPGDYEVGF